MPSEDSPRWREKATGFFSSSGVRLKQAGQSAGAFVGDVAKDAGENAADMAGKVGSMVKGRWALIQQARQNRPAAPPGESVQERLLSAAASTGLLLRKGFSETKEKVAVGKLKVEEDTAPDL
ncbi:putative Rho GTPase-activating protein [Cocos nucifera]|uniref:Putative Rho GTPase-activating protein n=1 Tax=Cocos nucifera TaxID=13894 RepID=A0A8K0IEL4_COCNU|nr:putative Rho GTPase-activating protein [Cocos nucifera]